MLYKSDSFEVAFIKDNIAEFKFCVAGSVNTLSQQTLKDCASALKELAANSDIKGMIFTSDKEHFIIGADIFEFLPTFTKPEAELVTWIKDATDVFDALEDLPFPTLSAINGLALGGGCEWVLATDYRVASTDAKIGLPEVKLGIMPGFGGTVRLPRIVGADNAMLWITSGAENRAADALKVGAVDAVVSTDKLIESGISTLELAISGKLDWQAKRQVKLQPLKLNRVEQGMSFAMAEGMVMGKTKGHYPAPIMAVRTIKAAANCTRDEAMAIENANFAKLARTPEAAAQTGIFLADQYIKGKARKQAKTSDVVIKQAAVLGAGIMGGGIAYQSAYKGTPIIMKDIQQDALDLGMGEASKLLGQKVQRGHMAMDKMVATLGKIKPTLNDSDLQSADIIVEAVVENPKVKQAVLAGLEKDMPAGTILTSNTSTIRIDELATALEKPENFCGMHFFNPVPKMPLVEIIRGEKTSEQTINAVVDYALKLGKSPIVVNDCPGFFVNRVLFPYFAGFSKLVVEGADFAKVDKVMENVFGWPMGPAYLLDVVGIDTAYHCTGVMADGFPERMSRAEKDPVTIFANEKRFGQKNKAGFYQYAPDRRGRLKKAQDPQAVELLSAITDAPKEFDKQEIIDRCMIPMINEVLLCLQENIVASPQEADMALIYGIGFPPFRGGAFRYLDQTGLANFVATADKYAHLGAIYQVSEQTRKWAEEGRIFYKVEG
ncbi:MULTISPECIES: fatty acid oxidation complex subunit alpha FadB [Pseudoalteromonas]|jgi:3-hydroxyacyl-CoA dehydrogenase/enoyl-CoA hydratase/3-hydroxybutyryl-CoA epimerase/enoyl-CoA isomerase|uniref:enoyl-CoA hydratase n=3 Tax=Pseudoalteromonas TaxID=53246 RepID=A0ABY3F9K0_9GAMM|nr:MULTISPECIES: fatty acid oxidation complex subunit alpha FadB [Pseudoalteromonas]MBB1302394.1 fatty acid oxidation complex subunit alpha FadB [Pseudoalteromonas sp. SR44-8]MBB1410489.1 fatty acid oxidation complex subunit alpha FadB [Pseudoalteromonas sp. SG44-17]MBB1506105.1 fatty acid oxidation complex subunit alpha FadB [Pseudoalteromonas sp. SG41-1]TVU80505.1 fatty acid oxidation complex subunit alpha FadB [Pseudoalteromonas neustonica]|tara:strand:- start:13545 stop:15704 length:2160 start_codon:yes stop_codon:yes gene_type:complete|eukprot:GDKH01010571.1.p1 GENE.GDKH01010571.1~~GDKH01010571.1.p1  ORF type:complete len:720 (+),score=142.77 GDKH01010571.1:114-2273(+)